MPDIISIADNLDWNLMDNFNQSLGLGKYKELFGLEPEEFKEELKTLKDDPSIRDMANNLVKDPSLIAMILNDPKLKVKIQNNPSIKCSLQNLHFLAFPQYLKMVQNMFKKNERNPIENSGTGISVPPEPFGSLNNNQINQMMNSSGQMKINTFNNNIENKQNFRNSSINLEYKEKYKEQLSQLKNMGFTNEEINIQALKLCNGNIENAFDKILEQNN